MYGILKFGRLPMYGIDPDPTYLKIDILNYIAIFPATISMITIPITFFLTTHLLVNKVQLKTNDKIGILISIICITLFFVSKYYWTNIFNWILD